jgi:hypothetical protein
MADAISRARMNGRVFDRIVVTFGAVLLMPWPKHRASGHW